MAGLKRPNLLWPALLAVRLWIILHHSWICLNRTGRLLLFDQKSGGFLFLVTLIGLGIISYVGVHPSVSGLAFYWRIGLFVFVMFVVAVFRQPYRGGDDYNWGVSDYLMAAGLGVCAALLVP